MKKTGKFKENFSEEDQTKKIKRNRTRRVKKFHQEKKLSKKEIYDLMEEE